ncbi:MAG: MBL fold metallo-hydrolase [Pseudomonadota bacterium]
MRISAAAFLLVFIFLQSINLAQAQTDTERSTPISTCMAIAQIPPYRNNPLPIVKVSTLAALSPYEVNIAYVGHSTFRIEDATGLKIATDFSGFAGVDVIPDVVTMNHAHSTHYTIVPDKRIPHVLRGWGKNGEPARHHLQVGETIIRNVTTNIDNDWVGFERDGNSIFIFEMGGLCIGHLGHLHHKLTEAHYAQIGRLDIVMVPVDGGYTLNVVEMAEVVKRLRASMVLPMHWFGSFSLQRFLTAMGEQFPVDIRRSTQLTVSLNTLPSAPTVTVLQPESSGFGYGGD